MLSEPCPHDKPGLTYFWKISCYQQLPFFQDDGMKQVVVDALRTLQQRMGICLIGYVVMPERAHMLVYPYRHGDVEPLPFAEILQAFKQYVGRYGKVRLRNVLREQGHLWSESITRWAHTAPAKQKIIEPRCDKHDIVTEQELRETLDYCHKNPVKRGIVGRPADWPWSSFRYYDQNDTDLLSMDWDGRWPIEW